ncbi:MAG: hypothetical protein WCR21_00615 [Bacteroidota bacterium]
MKTLKLQLFLCLLCAFILSKAQFNPGNLVVLQAGDGNSSLAGTGNPIVLREFNTLGQSSFSLAIPFTGNNAMVIRGNAVSEGYISRSADNFYIVFGGYMQALPNANTLNSTAASSIPRGIALVDVNGTVLVPATCSISSLASGDIRAATAANSLNLWSSSSSQGTSYFGSASAASNVQNSKSNLRAVHIFNNQLYISSQVASGTPADIGVYTVGSGTPNTSAQTVSTVINAGTGALPGQFYFNAAGNICYIADARSSSAGGIQKWVQTAGTWSLAYTLPTGTNAVGAFGVVADFSGTQAKVYATTAESSGNRLVSIIDVGVSSTATTLATATTSNTAFRGLAWSPLNYTCFPVSVITTSNNAPICSAQNLSLQVQVSGSAPITYSWSGQGVFSSNSASQVIVNHSASGVYTVTLSNACGTASAGIQVSINPTPSLIANAAGICAGGIATISASGANTYTWNNISTVSSFTASPVVTTIYTLNGTSAQGCSANTVTTAIIVAASPSLIVNTPTVCAGATATILAQGCSTYTWANGGNSTSLVVSPTLTSQYSLSANASGCLNTVSVIATVIVNALPSLSITNAQKLFCKSDMDVVLTATPMGGVFSGPFVSGNLFSPSTIGQYTVAYSYTNTNRCANSCKESFNVDACVGHREENLMEGFSVYPNPASNMVYIKSFILKPFHLLLCDVLGIVLFDCAIENNETVIYTENLPKGLYYLYTKEGTWPAKRFIKE